MIQFNEMHEKKDITKLFSSPAINNFWDNLFTDNPQSKTNEINEDDIWWEIFGRDEEKFQFDFEIDKELQSILE